MTARPINPRELLELADRLVGRRAGRGRPRSIELRRGVSCAYYALFHELAWRGTDALLQEGGWTPRAAAVSRWMTHTTLNQLAEVVTGARGNAALSTAIGPPAPELVGIGDAFSALQVERHRADYDDFYDLNRALATSLVETAREAVQLSARLSAQSEASYGIFLRLMLSSSQAKTRSN